MSSGREKWPSWTHGQPRSLVTFSRVLLFALLLARSASPLCAQNLRIQIDPEWNGKPIVLDREIPESENTPSFSRIDGLLSELALERTDGTWLKSEGWYVFFSAEKARLEGTADGLPPEEFQAIRFRVGLKRETDAARPGEWPPEHPLNPEVCGLHWGWQSGYVFLALEGHWGTEKLSGFSFHLAGPSEPMNVELPVSFSGRHLTTIRLSMDLAKVLDSGKALEEATSSHSRPGDAVAARMKSAVPSAFKVMSVGDDFFQALQEAAPPAKALLGTPYRLNISERFPKVRLPADNPLTVEGVALGRKLFHDARLSRNQSQSCASCHERGRGFTDGERTSIGSNGERGRRNAMALANLAWAKEFLWDGRARALREQVLMPIQDAHEMNETLDRVVAKLEEDSEYPTLFQEAFGGAKITSEQVSLALEQFLLTLVSQDSKFDRAARKLAELTAQEQRGLELFVTEYDPQRNLRGADCFHCHGGNLFSNRQFLNNGLEPRSGDRGRMEVTGLESDRGKFKVPSLRNVALTAPYMHDGRFATLEEVIEHYAGKLHRSPTLDPNLAKHPETGLDLSAADKEALVAFLKTLTGDAFLSRDGEEKQFSKKQE